MKTNKMILCAALAALAAGTAAAQEAEVFAPYHSLQLQGGAAYTLGEAAFDDLLSPAAAISWQGHFSPRFTLRAGVTGWESKGGFDEYICTTYKFNYLALNLDAMLDLTNVFGKWRPGKVFSLYAFVGPMANLRFHNDEAIDVKRGNPQMQMDYLWDDNHITIGGRGGLLADWRIGNWGISLEANANGLTDRYNSKRGDNIDWYFQGLAGVSYHFGKGSKKAPKPATEVVERVVRDTVYVTRIVEKEVPAPAPTVVTLDEYHVDLFYDIRSARISADDDAKLQRLAAWIKDHKTGRVLVAGYADRGTGTPKVNLMYSQQRADAVVRVLTETYGIPADQIDVEAHGDTVQPFKENALNRCVRIDVKEIR